MRTGRRSGIVIMKNLIGLIKPMLPIMFAAIFLGVVGYLCAIFITILAGFVYLSKQGSSVFVPEQLFFIIILIAVFRGVFHYGEQYCNHFIAFKLLAFIRKKVFAKLRELCPAKLEGRDKGNLISVITTDIELLEVFYAHTISPILIALSVSIIMIIFIGMQSTYAGIVALVAYCIVGGVIPIVMGKLGAGSGMENREKMGDMNSFILESLHGLDEIIQYQHQENRLQEIDKRSGEIALHQKKLNSLEAIQRGITNLAVFAGTVIMLFVMLQQYRQGNASYAQMVIAIISMMASFGPVIALSNLSNNLNQTLACGERVLDLLEETPLLDELVNGEDIEFQSASVKNVTFGYGDEIILKDCSLEIPEGKMIVVHGPSGTGKSTLLKLLMRFWDADSGTISLSGKDIKEINTKSLRNNEAYVTQETYLFHDSIASNIALGNPNADIKKIEEAARRASLHNFVAGLPDGYMTKLGELGDTVSGGEKQRIGLARAFFHDAPFLLLDEPTSNLDSLNEGIILKSLREDTKNKTVIMVTHRESTMGMGDVVIGMDADRKS